MRDYYDSPLAGISKVQEKFNDGYRTTIQRQQLPPIGRKHRCETCAEVSSLSNFIAIP